LHATRPSQAGEGEKIDMAIAASRPAPIRYTAVTCLCTVALLA